MRRGFDGDLDSCEEEVVGMGIDKGVPVRGFDSHKHGEEVVAAAMDDSKMVQVPDEDVGLTSIDQVLM